MGRLQLAANVALIGVAVAPFFVHVDPNINVVLTACLTVYVGCWRSVKGASPMETMSREHAMKFPLIGSAVLLGLFLLFKFLPKNLVNLVLTGYFVLLGVLALSATLLPLLAPLMSAKWNQQTIALNLRLPMLGSDFGKLDVEFTRTQLVAAVPAGAFCAWYCLKKHWLANNTLGYAFSVQGIEMLSLGSFKVGAILLAGLFFYDIFWVFCTPVMVSVAKSFDAPIKLLFPTGQADRPFSLLGLGDIVIPGIFLALALRFDMSRGKGVRYFGSAFGGYTAGLLTTIIVMNVFQAAQPALLYIVPAVMGSMAIHVLIRGELRPLLEYDETAAEEEDDKAAESEAEKAKEAAESKAAAAEVTMPEGDRAMLEAFESQPVGTPDKKRD